MGDNRTHTITQKVKTEFGSMYIHIHYDKHFRPCGGWISDPGKNPTSEISNLVATLSEGLNTALKEDPENATEEEQGNAP